MIDSRWQRTSRAANSRVDAIWLSKHMDLEDMQYVEDENASFVKNIVEWYGPITGSLALKINQSDISSMHVNLELMSGSQTKCLAHLIRKLFPDESKFTSELKMLNYMTTLYSILPPYLARIREGGTPMKSLPTMKLILDASTYILKSIDGPLFSIYVSKIIPNCIKFYKFLHKKDRRVNPENSDKE